MLVNAAQRKSEPCFLHLRADHSNVIQILNGDESAIMSRRER